MCGTIRCVNCLSLSSELRATLLNWRFHLWRIRAQVGNTLLLSVRSMTSPVQALHAWGLWNAEEGHSHPPLTSHTPDSVCFSSCWLGWFYSLQPEGCKVAGGCIDWLTWFPCSVEQLLAALLVGLFFMVCTQLCCCWKQRFRLDSMLLIPYLFERCTISRFSHLRSFEF